MQSRFNNLRHETGRVRGIMHQREPDRFVVASTPGEEAEIDQGDSVLNDFRRPAWPPGSIPGQGSETPA